MFLNHLWFHPSGYRSCDLHGRKILLFREQGEIHKGLLKRILYVNGSKNIMRIINGCLRGCAQRHLFRLHRIQVLSILGLSLCLLAEPAMADDNGADAEFSRNPVDISNQLERDSRDREDGLLPPVDLFKAWDEFKQGLHRHYGFQFVFDYQALYHGASSSPGDSDAASGWGSFFGSWQVSGDESSHPGKLGFKVENRHRLFTDRTPMLLGPISGSAWSTAAGWGKFDLSVTELWWEQHFVKDYLAFRAGKVLAFSLYDYSRFKNPKTGFLNQMFNINPAIPFPSFGLGAAVLARPRDDIYFVGGIHDANGKTTTSGFDTFFDDKEYFYVAELGWDPGNLSARRDRFFDGADYHITLWKIDERERAGKPGGQGFTIAAEQPVGSDLTLFARYGYADGGPSQVKQMITTGLGFGNVFGKSSDLISIGASWGRSHDNRDQYALEAFYRIQLTARFTITPDVQLTLDPVSNPDKDAIAYFGVRGRFHF